MGNPLNKGFIFCEDENGYSVVDIVRNVAKCGQKEALIPYVVKKWPHICEATKILMSSGVSFFYDPIGKEIKIFAKNATLNELSVDISNYYKYYTNNVKLESFCKENKISTKKVPNNFEKIVEYLSFFLAENNFELKVS